MPRPRTAAAFLGLVAGSLGSACGGGGSTAPSTSPATLPQNVLRAGTVLRVVSAETGGPVESARLVVAGRPYPTDSAGQATLGEDAPLGSFVDVIAPGFLDRQTVLRSESELRFSLWPRVSESADLDEQTSAELSFTSGSLCCPALPEDFAMRGLRRIRTGATVALVVDELAGLQEAVVPTSLQRAADLANVANEGRVIFRIGAPASASQPTIRVTIDANTCGPRALGCMTVSRDSQGYTTRGTLTLTEVPSRLRFGPGGALEARMTGLMAHELGHALGFGHSTRLGVMSAFQGVGTNIRYFDRSPDFSKTEKLLLSLAAQRRPNTTFPDNDREGPFLMASPRDEVVCVF